MADACEDQFTAFAKGVATYDGGDEEQYLAFFTDEDLARRFIEQFNLPPCALFRIPDREGFIALMIESERHGIHYVGLDAGVKTGRVYPIAEFRKQYGF